MADSLRSNLGLRNRKRRWAAAIATALFVVGNGGCTVLPGLQNALDYSDECNEWMLNYRNDAWAAKAWHRRKPCYCNRKHLDDFGAGFKAGYLEVANGGTGCTPAFAPRDYWSWKYQSPVGQQRVAAWFAGFPLGAQAAEEDGLGNYSQIMSSSAVQLEYQKAGWQSPAMPLATPMGPVTGSCCAPTGGAVEAGVSLSPSDMSPSGTLGAPTPVSPPPAPIPIRE